MKYLTTQSLVSGMITGVDVFDQHGNLLISKHSTITEEIKNRLLSFSIPGLFVENKVKEVSLINDMILEEIKISNIEKLDDINPDSAIALSEKIVALLLNNEEISLDMLLLKNFDNYTYQHSINVATICTAIGMKAGFTNTELISLSIAGMLHDIGKIEVDNKIINGQTELTKEELNIIRNHPEIGYKLVKNHFQIDEDCKTGIRYHHENFDGSGYPEGMKGTNIPEFARIIRIADVYEAMTAKRSYKESIPPIQVMEYILGHSNVLFDKKYVELFMKNIPLYKIGTEIKLSNGIKAFIFKNTELNTRPIILLENGRMYNLLEREYLNLVIV